MATGANTAPVVTLARPLVVPASMLLACGALALGLLGHPRPAQAQQAALSITMQPTSVPPGTVVTIFGRGAAPSRAAVAGAMDDAGAVLARFMDARIDRQDRVWQKLLTEELRRAVETGRVRVPTGQVSNPCWYRYEVLAFAQPTPQTAGARVHVFEHQWPGDEGGFLPHSWEQEIRLVWTPAGWRVGGLGAEANRRERPNEPHGPTTSACYAGRRPGVWLQAANRLPATGHSRSTAAAAGAGAAVVPAFAPAVLGLGLALAGGGLLIRRPAVQQ